MYTISQFHVMIISQIDASYVKIGLHLILFDHYTHGSLGEYAL